MDQIFYLMWLSDVVDQLSSILMFFFVMFCVSSIAYIAFLCLDQQLKPVAETQYRKAFEGFKFLPPLSRVVLVLGLLSVPLPFLPSKMTVQAAVVAQATVIASQTQLGPQAIEALNRVLKKIGN